jgi:hypothetical protein
MKRGRPTLLNAKLRKQICGLLAKGSSIKSATIVCGVGERTFHDWMERGENGEEPFASFFSAATRARERHKANLIAVVMEAAHKDARHAEWLLERQFPGEFAPLDRRPVPPPIEPQPVPDLSRMVKFTCEDIDLREFMEIEAKYKAMKEALGLRDEPVTVPAEREANGHHPIVGAGGRVVGWTDSDDSDPDADAETCNH